MVEATEEKSRWEQTVAENEENEGLCCRFMGFISGLLTRIAGIYKKNKLVTSNSSVTRNSDAQTRN